jgi:recombination protein RecA
MSEVDVDDIVSAMKKAGCGVSKASKREYGSNVNYWIPTGSTLLDAAICNGIPGGRIIEVVGDSATGKSALSFQLLGNIQKMGGFAIYLDTEQSIDLDFATVMGCDVDKLIIGEPETVEDLYDLTEHFVKTIREKSQAPILIIADSCTLPTNDENEKKMQEVSKVGDNAKMQRRGLRNLMNFISDNQVTFIGVNHVTANIGVMYGPKEVYTGGSGWKFYASVRIRMKSPQKVLNKVAGSIQGIVTTAEIIKNRHGPPHREVELHLDFHTGYNDVAAMLEFGKKAGLFGTSQGWYEFGGEKFRRQQLETRLNEDPEAIAKLRTQVTQLLTGGVISDEVQ